MEITLEQVERLREKANVSYEEAKAALEQAEGSLLDALIFLEKQGKVKSGAGKSAYCSTQPGGSNGPGSQDGQGGGTRADPQLFSLAPTEDKPGAGHLFRDLFHRSLENSLEVWRRGELMVSIPLLICALLLILAFWICLPLMVIGLAMGCRYRLAGPDFDRSQAGKTVNRAAASVGDTVEHLKDEAKRYLFENDPNHHNKK